MRGLRRTGSVNVVAKGAKDTRAIHVANNTEAQDKSATLTIVGDEVCITAESDDPGKLFKTPISERWGKQICLNE